MVSDKENFYQSGPTFLTAVDWKNSHHRRSIAASLVQGVYTLERDRQNNRQGRHALAPPWWNFFNFNLIQILQDNHDLSYFGAIFEYRHHPPPALPHSSAGYTYNLGPPRFVVAFRGTIRKIGNREQDFKLNLHCIINNLHNSTRFVAGLDATRDMAYQASKFNGPEGNVWVAGHSLGSSIALLVGRRMIKDFGIHLETYLFNPPFVSPPIQRLSSGKLKLGLRLANSLLTAGLATAAGKTINDPFGALTTWTPYLFVNPEDPICGEYEGYFEHREKMERIGMGMIGRIATKHSIGSIVGGGSSGEASHLIPTAYLSINVGPCLNFKEAHGIHQWWRPDLMLKYKLYQYRNNPNPNPIPIPIGFINAAPAPAPHSHSHSHYY